MGHEPRVALLSFSNFGQPDARPGHSTLRDAVAMLVRRRRRRRLRIRRRMSAEVALDYDLMRRLYPFCRLSGPANVLIMPALHAANIGAKMLQKMAGADADRPAAAGGVGMEKPAQVVQMGATVNDLVTARLPWRHTMRCWPGSSGAASGDEPRWRQRGPGHPSSHGATTVLSSPDDNLRPPADTAPYLWATAGRRNHGARWGRLRRCIRLPAQRSSRRDSWVRSPW